jgi:hypothetical protein
MRAATSTANQPPAATPRPRCGDACSEWMAPIYGSSAGECLHPRVRRSLRTAGERCRLRERTR